MSVLFVSTISLSRKPALVPCLITQRILTQDGECSPTNLGMHKVGLRASLTSVVDLS